MRPDRIQFRDSGFSSKSQRASGPPGSPREIVFVSESAQSAERNNRNGPSGKELAQHELQSPFPLSAAGTDNDLPQTRERPETNLSWPVKSEQEASLMRHFVSTVSHFFDFSDPRRHFARMVPQKARTNGTLASAVFALSARHLSRTSTFDAYVADMYYQRCLQQLIPALATEIPDESLLVAAVLLRLMEEIDVPITGADLQNHLFGTQAIVRALEQQVSEQSGRSRSGLLHAALWAALRQDLYIAFATRRPMVLSNLALFRTCHGDKAQDSRMTGQTSDEEDARWANMAVVQCCDVAQYIFGESGHHAGEYERLKTVNLSWKCYRPSSFDPFYRKESPAQSSIPNIRLLMDWHVMGHMYNLLALVLLESHKPIDSRHERNHSRALRSATREMLGIAMHNPDTPSAHLVASMAIAMCSRSLTMEDEIAAMRQILADTERVHGWPTLGAQLSSYH